MTESETIVCKPTRWFLFRALVMVVMFGVFAVLFYIDGSSGYRKKNEAFYLKQTFEKANAEFVKMNQGGNLSPAAWKAYAAAQTVDLPADPSVLPAGMAVPMPWPEILHDSARMQSLQWNGLWREYTKQRGLNEETSEEAYDARKIGEQWVVFYICTALTITTGFFLVRALRRSITADATGITDQRGRRVAYGEMQSLDLRRWDTKGLAFVAYTNAAGSGRLRIDGLTYGGFRKEDGEPAEKLMDLLRSRFSGEVTEYAALPAAPAAAADSHSQLPAG